MSATSPSPSTPVKRPVPDIPFYFASPPPSSPGVDVLNTSSSSSPYPVTPLPRPTPHVWSAQHPSTTASPVPRRLLELTPDPTAIFATPERGQHDDGLSPSLNGHLYNNGRVASGKRGRPRADLINHLIVEGSSSPSEIKCKVCNRVFPREKSLQVC